MLNEKSLKIESAGFLEKEKKVVDVLFISGQSVVGRFSNLETLKTALAEEGEEVSTQSHQLRRRLEFKSISRQIFGMKNTLSCNMTVHCLTSSARSLWTITFPTVILSRFFGRRVIVQLSCCHLVDHIIRWQALIRPVLLLADRILVESRLSAYKLGTVGLANTIRQLPFHGEKKVARGIDSVQPRMLIVSPLDRDHNPACALRAFGLVKQKYPRAEIVIAGNGPLLSSLHQMVAESHLHGVSIVSHPESGDSTKLFDEVDIYLNVASSSCSVGWLMEALSRGLPVVSSDESNALELIRDNQNGLVFGINNHVQMAEKIITLIESPVLVSAISSQASLGAHQFSWESVRPQWLSLYQFNH